MRTTFETLLENGHIVRVSDLYADAFQPVSGRGNFTTLKDGSYFKPQQEELYATQHDGFSPDIEDEIQKLESAVDLLFSLMVVRYAWDFKGMGGSRICYGSGLRWETDV